MCHKLREVRESLGLTQADLHELSGVSVETISRIENEDKTYKINKKTARLLAGAIYFTVLDIFKPEELSHLGRPPLTGKPIGVQTQEDVNDICPGCSIKRPVTGVCDTCPPVAVPQLALVG
jgi:DNA-binding XRE family transcriptional regulator